MPYCNFLKYIELYLYILHWFTSICSLNHHSHSYTHNTSTPKIWNFRRFFYFWCYLPWMTIFFWLALNWHRPTQNMAWHSTAWQKGAAIVTVAIANLLFFSLMKPYSVDRIFFPVSFIYLFCIIDFCWCFLLQMIFFSRYGFCTFECVWIRGGRIFANGFSGQANVYVY